VTDTISPEFRQILRRLKLGPILETLPERLTLARQQKLPHQDFLELVLSNEVSRRDRVSGHYRARVAQLDPAMRMEAWDPQTEVRFDRQLWSELCSLRFLEDAFSVIIMGPVGVGKTMLANCLGHIACRRRHSVLMFRTERLLKRLRAARLDASYEAELRRLLKVDLLILDDFALQTYDHQETQDLYEIVVERHRRASLVVVSNREPKEWLATMADPLLAQSAVDRLLNSTYELVLGATPSAGARNRRGRQPHEPRRNASGDLHEDDGQGPVLRLFWRFLGREGGWNRRDQSRPTGLPAERHCKAVSPPSGHPCTAGGRPGHSLPSPSP